jgi:homoserine acetyltransferase
MEALAARLPCATLQVIGSIYGHDAFLKEQAVLRTLFVNALGQPPAAPTV